MSDLFMYLKMTFEVVFIFVVCFLVAYILAKETS